MDGKAWFRRAGIVGEWTLTALSIVAAVIFVTSASKAFLAANTAGPIVPLKPGSVMDVADVKWADHRATLLIALQADCAACDASAAFLRDLVKSNVDGRFHPIVVVPYAATAGGKQLADYRLDIADVHSASFQGLGIPGTPALLLVGPDGRLKKGWIGKLPTDAEDAVFRAVGVKRLARTSTAARGTGYEGVTATELSTAAMRLSVLDTRPRAEFTRGHVVGAFNIPADEIAVRLRREWRPDREVALFCERPPTCDVYLVPEAGSARSHCELAVDAIRAGGVARVRILDATLDELEHAGVPVARDRSR